MKWLPFLRRNNSGSPYPTPPANQIFQVVLFALALGLSGLQWSTIYAGYGALPPILISAVVALGVGLVVANKLRSAAQSIPIGIVILLLGSAAWYGSDSRSVIGDMATSWKLLASTGLLAPTRQEFVLVPVVTVFIAGWLGAEMIARRQPPLAITVPLALAHVTALSYTVSQRQPNNIEIAAIGIAPLAIAAISNAARHPSHVATGSPEQRQAATRKIATRHLLGSIPLAIVLGAAGIGAEKLLGAASNNPFDLRERLVRPLEVYETTSPLSQVKTGLIAQEPSEVFAISVDGLPSDETISRIIVATLDVYDGALWSSSARFEDAGAVLPAPDQHQSLDARPLLQATKINPEYRFHFLPRVGQVTQTDSLFLGWDPRSGSLANVDPERAEYSFSTKVQRSALLVGQDEKLSDLAALNSMMLSDPTDELRYATALPELTEQQIQTLNSILASTDSATAERSEIAVLEDLEEFLRSNKFAFNPNAASGHGAAALISYLANATDTEELSIGSTEHSAGAFALLARYMGIPSRIVVGYELVEPLSWDAQRQVVTEDLIHAWPEVWVDGYGWLAFEPTNKDRASDAVVERSPILGDTGSETADTASLPELQTPVLIPEPEQASATNRRLLVVATLIALPLLFALGVIAIKRMRRSARNRGSAADRISGAWIETRDTLSTLDLPCSRSSTVLEIAEELNRSGHMSVAVPVAKMADTVTKALYAPEEPSQAEADAMWSQARIAIEEAGALVSRGRRIRSAANPRVLLKD